jgi:hypothetical protein
MEPNQNYFPNSQSEDNNINRFDNNNINKSNFNLNENNIEKIPEVKSENSSLFQKLDNYKVSESSSSGVYQKNKEEKEKISSKKENEKTSSKEENENNLSQNFDLLPNINDLKKQLKSTKEYLSQKLDKLSQLSLINCKLLFQQIQQIGDLKQILLNQNSNLEKIVSLLEKK